MSDRCTVSMTELDIREKLAHIDRMLADHDCKRQEIRLAPWQLAMTGMGAGAALFAAGAAFTVSSSPAQCQLFYLAGG